MPLEPTTRLLENELGCSPSQYLIARSVGAESLDRYYADLRPNSSSFSLQPQLEQLRQQKRRMPTATVISTAKSVPDEKSLCAR